MIEPTTTKNIFLIENGYFLPSVSIDCVIFGFYKGELKILLNRFNELTQWMLPGGFILSNENVDAAAHRILKERTGLDQLFLSQFHLFGDCNRNDQQLNQKMAFANPLLSQEEIKNHWFMQRFVSLGYFALVDFSKVKLKSNPDNEESGWFYIKDIPELCYDHNFIIGKAIFTLRMQLGSLPIGYELLPEKFLMSDLRVLYETILGKSLDRRNFQRKILASGLIKQLDEKYTEGAFKPAHLYSFDKEKYKIAMDKGLPIGW